MTNAQNRQKRLINCADRNLSGEETLRMLCGPAGPNLGRILRSIVPLHLKTWQPDSIGFIGSDLARYGEEDGWTIAFRENAVTEAPNALEHLCRGSPSGQREVKSVHGVLPEQAHKSPKRSLCLARSGFQLQHNDLCLRCCGGYLDWARILDREG